MSRDPNIRVSDEQRARAVAELARHAGQGRLSGAEFEARTARVQQAGAVGDIDAVFADLPRSTGNSRWRLGWGWQLWAAASLLIWAIWAVGVATSKDHNLSGIWPVWVTVPWAAAILMGGMWRKD
jgi:hypothetical protein